MNYNNVESTGRNIRKFETGSVRDNAEGKGRFDLIPFYPLQRLAVHFENGAKKYGDRNWEKGQPLNEYLSSAMRHLGRFIDGENGEDHLSAVIWNCMAFIHSEREITYGNLPQSLLDGLPPKIKNRILFHQFVEKGQSIVDEINKKLDERNLEEIQEQIKKDHEAIEAFRAHLKKEQEITHLKIIPAGETNEA